MPTRVLITREFAEPLEGQLSAAGLSVFHAPLVQLVATGAPKPETVPEMIVITSAAVARFLPNLAAQLPDAPVAAVGEATAEALRAVGVRVALQGDSGGGELIARLPDSGARLWYVGAANPSGAVQAALGQHRGPVDCWAVYENQQPDDAAELLKQAGRVDMVLLTSASGAERYASLCPGPLAPAAVIGKATSVAAKAAGIHVALRPKRPNLIALAQAVKDYLGEAQ